MKTKPLGYKAVVSTFSVWSVRPSSCLSHMASNSETQLCTEGLILHYPCYFRVIRECFRIINVLMKVRDSVREVVATYSIDEGSMELVVSLPNNYPLGGLNVDSGKRVGVETGKSFF